jgi:hypothetical protein
MDHRISEILEKSRDSLAPPLERPSSVARCFPFPKCERDRFQDFYFLSNGSKIVISHRRHVSDCRGRSLSTSTVPDASSIID